MKKLITAVLGGIAVASVAFASASSLDVNGGVIQAGQTQTLECDDNGVTVKWGLESDTGLVTSVRVFDIADACVGGKLYVKTNAMKSALNAPIVANDNTNSTSIKFGTAVHAQDLDSLNVIIER